MEATIVSYSSTSKRMHPKRKVADHRRTTDSSHDPRITYEIMHFLSGFRFAYRRWPYRISLDNDLGDLLKRYMKGIMESSSSALSKMEGEDRETVEELMDLLHFVCIASELMRTRISGNEDRDVKTRSRCVEVQEILRTSMECGKKMPKDFVKNVESFIDDILSEIP